MHRRHNGKSGLSLWPKGAVSGKYGPMNVLISLLIGVGLPALLAYAFKTSLNFGPLTPWFLALNLVLFALMGKDKLAAKNKASRTPELTLLVLTFLGGTIGLFAGRYVFKHKTSKQEFNAALYAVIGAQAVCVWYFWRELIALI
jgi:uncharacterized membrane protein YsdA (DUF1294 family)